MSDSGSKAEDKDQRIKELTKTLSEELGTGSPIKKSTADEVDLASMFSKPAAPSMGSSSTDDVPLDFMVSAVNTSETMAAAEPIDLPKVPESVDLDDSTSEELSLEELDKLLNDQDPAFSEDISELRRGLEASTKGLALDLSKFDEEISEGSASTKKGKTSWKIVGYFKKLFERIQKVFLFLGTLGRQFKRLSLTALTFLRWLYPIVLRKLKILGERLAAAWKWYGQLPRIKKINFVVFLGVVFVFIFVLAKSFQGEWLASYSQSPFLKNFERVADRIELLKSNEPLETFDNPLRNPEYVVLLKKMFVNLRQSSQSTRNPMAAFELFLEADNQEAAIELKDRENQFRDIIARLFEAMPYDEIITGEGRDKLKLLIRRNINQIINKGRVKKVYFKTFFYKR